MAQGKLAPGETAKIAEEAFVYGLPLVMNYGVFYEYFVDKSGPQFKAEPNHLYNTARVYTPQDTAIVTPNSDNPLFLRRNGPSRRTLCRLQSCN
jgi:hypothetical protein